ncbi:MAG: PTS sugar transporter subunit IIA [candidate division KSB1 bacterium]|nr:PTS sugar transporter subunit IIA [candidate division KSB1 bacterium]MDZ7300849.1 PTS sugar transporter subunit IIA [candidate division KSB1 bacterium]MDZ7309880.1 PTS sugar transporter subunit IIA [candidate division KSB1 bacterium]
MQLSEFLSEQLILLGLEAKDKIEAFRAMVARMASQNAITSPETFLEEVIKRESIEPTCIGRGVAFPHTRTMCVTRPVIALGRTKASIPFTSNDSDNVQLIFVMGTPKDDSNTYLQILARLCRLLRQNNFRERLLTAATPKEIVNLFNEFDTPAVEQSMATN